MKRKTASIKGFLTRMFVSITLFFLVAVTVYSACLLTQLRRQAQKYNNNATKSYVEAFDNALQKIQNENQSMTVNNLSMKTMAIKNSTQAQRIEAEYRLRELLAIQTPEYGMTMICKPESGYILYHYGDSVNKNELFLQQSAFMHMFTERISDPALYVYDQWCLYQEGGQPFLFLVNHYNQVYLCSIIDLNVYLAQHGISSYGGYASTLVRLDDQVLVCPEGLADSPLRCAPPTRDSGLVGAIICSAVSELSHIEVCLVTQGASFIPEAMPGLIIYGFVIVIIFVILHVVLRIVEQSLLFPLQEIAIRSAELLGKNADGLISQEQDFEEYNRIRSALNDLVAQKRALEQSNITAQEQKEHVLLQYYQLQTRSHFFINCLKSLYGMAERNSRSQMQSMIIAFSNHLRYIFHDNLSCVTLADEMKEVDDYHRIISQDSPVPFLLNKDVPRELLGLEVPQLIIQTFLENTFKYADRRQGILIFHVEVETVVLEGRGFLQFHIFDNGGGYPEQFLSTINAEPDETFSTYNVGIANLRHRLRILYNENCMTHFYNEAGGAHSLIRIPATRRDDGDACGLRKEKQESQSRL